MPVAKGAGYVLNSVNNKKKREKSIKRASVDQRCPPCLDEANDNSLPGEAAVKTTQKRHRGCRHCRRNHRPPRQIDCEMNMCVKCVGCEKTLRLVTSDDRDNYLITVRSCCADYRGRLAKVR